MTSRLAIGGRVTDAATGRLVLGAAALLCGLAAGWLSAGWLSAGWLSAGWLSAGGLSASGLSAGGLGLLAAMAMLLAAGTGYGKAYSP
jgi:hypothetical protein